MTKAKYDEFQLMKRHKIGYQTFILLLVIIWMNGYVKSRYGVWAEPFLESLVLMVIPGFYFAGASIWKNAYLRLHDNPIVILLFVGFVAIFGLIILSVVVFSESFHVIENGQLGGDIGLVLITCLFLMMCVLLLVKRKLDS